MEVLLPSNYSSSWDRNNKWWLRGQGPCHGPCITYKVPIYLLVYWYHTHSLTRQTFLHRDRDPHLLRGCLIVSSSVDSEFCVLVHPICPICPTPSVSVNGSTWNISNVIPWTWTLVLFSVLTRRVGCPEVHEPVGCRFQPSFFFFFLNKSG